MGKQSRLKASTKGKKRRHHADPPAAPAAIPQEMEEARVSPPPEASSHAVPQKACAAAGRILAVRPTSPEANSPTSAEEVQHLRALNGMLARQMVEVRQEGDQDQALLSDLERGVIRAALASQRSQEAGRLARLAEGADAAGKEAAREVGERLAATELKWAEAVAGIEKAKAAAREEAARLKRDLMELAQDKAEVEKQLRTAETGMDAIRGCLQDTREALERAQGENDGFKKDLKSLVLERDETQKHLDGQMEERKALEIMIFDLEARQEEARQALHRALSECSALEEDAKDKEAALELLTQEKDFLEKSLAESLRMVEDLTRQMGEVVRAKDEEVNKVVGERDEAREGLHLRLQEMKGLVARAREVAGEMLESVLSQCQPLEETVKEWNRDLELLMGGEPASAKESVLADALRLLNNLSGEMVKAAQAKGEVLELTKAEMEKVISKKEQELAGLAKANVTLNSELASLREVHESLKAQEEGLRSQVAELDMRNGDAQKVLDRLRVELKKQVEEEEENTRSYQLLVEGHLHQMEDLRRKLAKAAEERDEVEMVNGKKEDQILELQESVAQLNSEIAALRELSSDQAREKELLRAESNGVVERLGEQTHKAEALMLELRQLEKTKRTVEQELGVFRAANTQLLAEKEQMERQVDSLVGVKASAQESLSDAERRLEDAEKKAKALRELAKQVLSMMKSAAAEAARGAGGGVSGAEGEAKPAEVVEDIGPFAAAMEAIRAALGRREAEMEKMTQELQKQRANARWTWISSAVVGFSATALGWAAVAARGR